MAGMAGGVFTAKRQLETKKAAQQQIVERLCIRGTRRHV